MYRASRQPNLQVQFSRLLRFSRDGAPLDLEIFSLNILSVRIV
jgi:hypothetical protein